MKRLLAGSAPYLKQKGGLRTLEYLLYNFPFDCDYGCEYCCNSDRLQPEVQLSENELQRIIEDAADIGLRVFGSMGLGEPLISENFESSIKFAHNVGLIPYIFTTAFNLDKERADMLAEHGASLIVHIDTLDRDDYHEICRGKSNLNTVLQNLEYAKTQFCTDEKLADNAVTRIGVNMVARKQNIGAANELAQFCEDNDFAFVLNTLLDETDPKYVSEKDFPIRTVPLGTASEGVCEYLKRGIAIQGNKILVCPYSDIEVSEIPREGLTSGLETGWKYATEFFAWNGSARCIMRHPNYEK